MFHPSLFHNRVTIHPNPGIQEEIGDVPQSTRHFINQVFTFSGSIKPSGDSNLTVLPIFFGSQPIFIGESQVYLCHPQRFPAICPVEDDILHQLST